jgi:ribosome-associated protein
MVEQLLDDNKAEDIVSIELPPESALADCMIIASGRSTRQVSALTQYLIESLKKAGIKAPVVEGLEQSDWVVIDTGDIIIHIFRPEVREFYNLERIWCDDDNQDNTTSTKQKAL